MIEGIRLETKFGAPGILIQPNKKVSEEAKDQKDQKEVNDG